MSQKPVKREIPWVAISLCLLLLAGTGLLVGGVYELAGRGWALISAAVACLLPAGVLIRGVRS